MKTLYIECNMGAAGDMLMSALYGCIEEKELFLEKMNSLLDRVSIEPRKTSKCGIRGTRLEVKIDGIEEESMDVHKSHHHEEHSHVSHEEHHHEGHSHVSYEEHHHEEHSHVSHEEHHHEEHSHGHHHFDMHSINHIIEGLNIDEKVKEDVRNIYQIIARAESEVHGVEVDKIHFHEVGELDAIADITGVCILMNMISPDVIISSPIHTGRGYVRCAHGVLPVPAPATALILQDVPIYAGDIEGELITPTGAAIIKYFAKRYGQMPQMRVAKVGYGMGKKDFAKANLVRIFCGESEESAFDSDIAYELSCNLDDISAEELSFACDIMNEAGALDVYTIPIGMKKSRSACMLNVLCKAEDIEKMQYNMLKYTTTLGVRVKECHRKKLTYSFENVDTRYGSVSVKVSKGADIQKFKPEFEDMARLAKKNGVTIKEIYNEVIYNMKEK